jgi:hypothetical protein
MTNQLTYTCESGKDCKHTVSMDAWVSLSDWRDENDADDLYIVRSDCAKDYEVVQRYGNYCVIRDKREDGRRV